MKIIFVSTEFLVRNKPSTGLPNYLYRVSKALQKLGHTPIIVTAGELDEHTDYDGIEVYRRKTNYKYSNNTLLNFAVDSLYHSYILNKEVKKICKSTHVDIIQFTSLRGLSLLYLGKVPAVMRLSSYAKLYFRDSITFSPALVKLMTKFELLSSRRMKGVFGPSYVMAREYAKDSHKKVAVIETPFENDAKEMKYEVYNAKLQNKKYLLFFGTLYAEKGIFVITKIIYQLLDKYPEYYFVFAGNVKEYDGESTITTLYKAAKQYKGRIIYLKPLCHEKLYPIIEKSHIVVLPSLMENFANACIEAMYFGKVVVGTDGTSFEQLITDGVNGYLSIPGDAKSLYNAIDKALKLSEDEIISMSQKARERIELLKTDLVVKKLIRYYQYIIN